MINSCIKPARFIAPLILLFLVTSIATAESDQSPYWINHPKLHESRLHDSALHESTVRHGTAASAKSHKQKPEKKLARQQSSRQHSSVYPASHHHTTALHAARIPSKPAETPIKRTAISHPISAPFQPTTPTDAVIGVAPPPKMYPRFHASSEFSNAAPATVLPTVINQANQSDQEPTPNPYGSYSSSLPTHYTPPLTQDDILNSTRFISPVAPPDNDNPSERVVRNFGNPTPLYGSHEILLHQNEMADQEGLERIRNDAQLNHLRSTGQLLPLPVSTHLIVDPRLPVNRRYCRPWTAKFLSDISAAYYAVFGQPLRVDSAVRTIAVQEHLVRINGNAAPASGATASPHLTGAAIDITKRSMTAEQLAWMRKYLLAIEDTGKIDVEEEFQQAVFHISVYKHYAPANKPVLAHAAPENYAPTLPN